MRIVFSVQSPLALKNFESVVRLLGERGHEVHVLVHRPGNAQTEGLVEALSEVPGVAFEEAVHDLERGRLGVAADVRASLDLLYFLHERFHETYRERSLRRAPRPLQRFAATGAARSRAARAVLAAGLRGVERALGVDPEVRRRLAALAPDALLLTPYIGLRTIQPEYLRAARSLGIPSAVCVASWDNLTSKSLIRPLPDRVLLWNEIQRGEAVRLHGVPAERVVVTGAQCFDQWFEWRARPREEFCARLGVNASRPLVLYVCFTPFVRAAHQDEAAFVRRWLEAVRGRRGVLADATVVVRPHPKRLDAWNGVDLSLLGAVVWPRDARPAADAESKADYFDSIFHSAAVVGLNSTALLEAGLVGRPVLTVLAPEFWESQEGTLHFRYLMEAGGGLLRAARTLDEHAEQLEEAVRGDDREAPERSRRFLEAFVRPHGLDVPATPVFADAVEELGLRASVPGRTVYPSPGPAEG